MKRTPIKIPIYNAMTSLITFFRTLSIFLCLLITAPEAINAFAPDQKKVEMKQVKKKNDVVILQALNHLN